MYNPNRLSGIRRVTLITETPQNIVWSCQTASELLISVIRLLLLSPRAKTTECFTGFFFWRLCNAVRRWLHLGIPCYTSELKQGRWAKDRGLKRNPNKIVIAPESLKKIARWDYHNGWQKVVDLNHQQKDIIMLSKKQLNKTLKLMILSSMWVAVSVMVLSPFQIQSFWGIIPHRSCLIFLRRHTFQLTYLCQYQLDYPMKQYYYYLMRLTLSTLVYNPLFHYL